MSLIILFIYLLTFFTRYNLRSDDLNVYVPYIEKLIDGYRLSYQYDYQAFYWVVSIYTKVFYRLFPNLEILPIGLIVTSTTLVLFVLIYVTFKYLYRWIQNACISNQILFYAVMIYILFQFWYIVYPSYGNTFRRLSVIWILISLGYYINNPNRKLLLLLFIEFIALVNFSSTGIFLSAFLLYGIAHLLAFTKQKEIIKTIWFLSIPFSIWLSLYTLTYFNIIIYFNLFVLITLLIKKTEILDTFWIKYHKLFLYSVPIVFVFLTWLLPDRFASYMPWINFFTNPEYEMLIHYLRFDFGNLRFSLLSLVNIGFWFALLFSLTRIHKISKIEVKSILYLILVILITFFNPLVARFVISNLTNLAYFRIYDLLFNPFTLYLYFYVLWSSVQHKTMQKLVLSVSVLVLGLGVYLSDVWPYLDFSGTTDAIHHVSKDELEVFNLLEEYVSKEGIEEPINIIVQIHGAHLLTTLELNRQTLQRVDNVDELFSKTDDGSKLSQIFMIKTSNEMKYIPPYKETCTLSQASNTQFVVVEAQYNWDVEHELGYCAEKIFEVGNYRVFRMRYEWLEWYQ